MIVINGTVSDDIKQQLKAGKTHPVARRHANLIIAGGILTESGGVDEPEHSYKIQFTVTGNESFTYSSNSKAVYFMNNDLKYLSKDEIVLATCTHFTYGDGGVLADMNEGEFIFNVDSAMGATTGNVSFKDTSVLTSKDASIAWFKQQYANGTPVVVTVYFV